MARSFLLGKIQWSAYNLRDMDIGLLLHIKTVSTIFHNAKNIYVSLTQPGLRYRQIISNFAGKKFSVDFSSEHRSEFAIKKNKKKTFIFFFNIYGKN